MSSNGSAIRIKPGEDYTTKLARFLRPTLKRNDGMTWPRAQREGQNTFSNVFFCNCAIFPFFIAQTILPYRPSGIRRRYAQVDYEKPVGSSQRVELAPRWVDQA